MNRQDKINRLAACFEGCGITQGMSAVIAKDILDEIFPPLEPVDTDACDKSREYIPMGPYEAQTKGNGSSYRLAQMVEPHDRIGVPTTSHEHDFITQMFRDMRKWYGE